MPKIIAIFILLFCARLTLVAQQPGPEDYKIYSVLIDSEIADSAKSVEIIRKSVDYDIKSSYRVINAIKSSDTSEMIDLFWGEPEKVKDYLLHGMDSSVSRIILRYYESGKAKFSFDNEYAVKVKTILLKKSSIKKYSRNNLENFYAKYPGSGGLFRVSPICYSDDKKLAVFYHTRRRNGLNGHGALIVMENIAGTWKIKYHIYAWMS